MEKSELLKDELSNHAENILEMGKEKMSETMEATQGIVEKTGDHLADAKQKVVKTAKETQSDFDKGIKTAVKKLRNA